MRQTAFIGMDKNEIDTPALLIDLDALESNIKTMSEYFKEINTNLRPHFKAHKSTAIAHMQMAAGAIGITCAKLGEAEVLAEAGIKDILIANQIVGPLKIARLVNLAKHTDMMVAVDSQENVKAISEAAIEKGVRIRVLVEVDVGMERCGVISKEQALDLARFCNDSKGIQFCGLMGFEGGVVEIAEREERVRRGNLCMDRLEETKNYLEANGIDIEIMSGGGSGTHDIAGPRKFMTEIQAGTYVFMDSKYLAVEGMEKKFKPALTVLTTVISRPAPDRLHTDCGRKSASKDFGIPQPLNIDGLEQRGLSEEHGNCRVHKPLDLKIGDKFELLPTHSCTTVNLHDYYYGIRNGKLEVIWKVSARGKSN